MSAASMAQTPAVPPRPNRSSDNDAPAGGLMPAVPPRPVNKRLDRSVSPGLNRFAQSPLMQGIPPEGIDSTVAKHYAQKEQSKDPIERSRSVDLPSLGEEGMEYGAVADELDHEEQQPATPEQTRLVAQGLKLHAPKPSLPASSAKKQVMAVTRTDSDRAASFGIGQPSAAEDRAASRGSNRKQRPASTISAYSDNGDNSDEDHGIPEIGQRVPMNKHLGDVQAPSPGPGAEGFKKHHSRKHSARNLPPGSYGLHGHGVAPQDKLQQAYYQKHPEALEREQHTPLHDRPNDFAMSSSDLNRLVRDTANRHPADGPAEFISTPTDDVAFEATEKYANRISSRPPSIIVPSSQPDKEATDDKAIHVEDGKNPEFYNYGEVKDDDETEEYSAPILASDEVRKDPSPHKHHPAIRPRFERNSSSYDGENPPKRPTSRPRLQRFDSQPEVPRTPLEDVEEYAPLFPEDEKEAKKAAEKAKQEEEDENHERHHFPSKDIWEDAPNSVHFTTEVSTPDVPEGERRRSSAYHANRPITPAQAFALYQEQLAEKEANGRVNTFLPLQDSKPTWVGHQPHLQTERHSSGNRRFPSRDIWEDAPESHIHEAEVSGSPVEQAKPEIPVRPAKKPSVSPERPAIPDRPKPRQSSGDDATRPRPPVSDKPKPSLPPRPTKTSPVDTKDGVVSKPKPPVPTRPVGGKIAALQAGFMNDLNKRLQLGPQVAKKEEPSKEEEEADEKDKAPLSDARKGRARGPQRRAPAAATMATSDVSKSTPLALSFSMPQTVWSIDPDDGDFAFCDGEDKEEVAAEKDNKIDEAAEAAAASDKTEPEEKPHVIEQKLTSEPAPLGDEPAVTADEAVENTETKGGEQVDEEAKEETAKEEVTLSANPAGESILEATVKKDGEGVEPVDVQEDVKA